VNLTGEGLNRGKLSFGKKRKDQGASEGILLGMGPSEHPLKEGVLYWREEKALLQGKGGTRIPG